MTVSNQFAQDTLFTIFNEIVAGVDSSCALSSALEKRNIGEKEGQHSGDVVHVSQEYQYLGFEGIETTDGDIEESVQRMIPIVRDHAVGVMTQINTKQLRDEFNVQQIIKGMTKQVANKIDLYTWDMMIKQASLVQTSDAALSIDDIAGMSNAFDMLGYGAYSRKAFLSGSDYRGIAKDLGEKPYSDPRTTAALERARIPSLLGAFESYKSDYDLKFAKTEASGITVTSNTSHIVATKNANGSYKDNRSGQIALSGASAGDIKVGDKFTIEGVEACNREVHASTGELQSFTVVEINTDGSIYTVSPAIISSGQYQNVSAQAASGAAVTFLNEKDSKPSLFFLPESTVILPGILPVEADGIAVGSSSTPHQGLPMRMTKVYDQHKEHLTLKLLCYFDVAVVQPDMLGIHLSKQG